MPGDDAVAIDGLLRSLGFTSAGAMAAARAALESAGLTRAGKRGIASYKVAAARKAIASALVRVCSDACARIAESGDTTGWAHAAAAPSSRASGTKRAAGGRAKGGESRGAGSRGAGSRAAGPRAGRRPVVVTPATSCEVCGGSNNRRAALAARASLLRAKARRVLVVGGTSTQQTELRALLGGDGIELAFVDGTSHSHSQRDAIANMRRSDLVVVWGSTPLRHAVSDLYTEAPVSGVRVIAVARRGIEALCGEIVRSFGGG